MSNIFQLALDWAEVWGPLIPLTVLFMKGQQPAFLKPVIFYLWFAFFIDLAGNIIADYKESFPSQLKWIHNNLVLYSVHSIVRFISFSYFFSLVAHKHYNAVRRFLPFISLVFILVNFTQFENFFHPVPERISSNLLSVEAYLLLIYCMLYYLSQLNEDVAILTSGKEFWVATGVSFYVVINFFVFLFYDPMIDLDRDLANNMWSIHNIAYIILCTFIAKAFYVPVRN
jgi:hypothetical protein